MGKMSLQNMIDTQKERIRQKICAAISEIWHKETGSILPHSIEGTVCITPSPGRTTAFQISSHIPGKFLALEEVDDASEIAAKRMKVNEFGKWCSNEATSGDGEEQSVSWRQSKPLSICDPNNNHSEMMDAEIQPDASERLSPDDDSSETSDQEGLEYLEAELTSDSPEYSHNDSGEVEESQDDGMNNDSGVHDLSTGTGRGNDNGCHHQGVEANEVTKTDDPKEITESVDKESDESRVTPPPLVIDLSSREPSQPVISLMYDSANVQTAIRNMLSTKLVATSICKITSGKVGGGDILQLTPVVSANGTTTPHLILQKTVKADELVKFAPHQAQNFSKQSTPVSFVCPIIGKQFIPRPLQGILSIPNPVPVGSCSLESPARLEVPSNISPKAPSSNISSCSIKAEPGIEQLANNIEPKSYRCEYCQKTFLFRSKYQEHLPVHTTDRPFECHICQRTYKYKYDLNVHQRTHQGIPTKSTTCPKCSQRFPTNKLLRVHINEVHKDDDNVPKLKSGDSPEENCDGSVPLLADIESLEEKQLKKSETAVSTSEIQ